MSQWHPYLGVEVTLHCGDYPHSPTPDIPLLRLLSTHLVINRRGTRELPTVQKSSQLIIQCFKIKRRGRFVLFCFCYYRLIYYSQRTSWRSKVSASDEGNVHFLVYLSLSLDVSLKRINLCDICISLAFLLVYFC